MAPAGSSAAAMAAMMTGSAVVAGRPVHGVHPRTDPLPVEDDALTMSTVVRFHRRLGRLCFAIVEPFRHLIARAMPAGTARILRAGA